MVETFKITPAITLLDLDPPIPGFHHFIGAYICRGDRTAVIDPGPTSSIPNLLGGLKGIGVRPQEVDYIILTHIHADHAGGVGAAVREMPNASVIAHSRAHQHLVDPTNLWHASQKTLGDLADIYGHFAAIVGRGESLGPEVSLLKIWATETFQRIADLIIETAGDCGGQAGVVEMGGERIELLAPFYKARPSSIYGGSNEIQRNILARQVLNLPR